MVKNALARLQEMQTNPETYRNEPDSDAYETWSETFDLDSKKGEISELLVNNPDVRRLYTKFAIEVNVRKLPFPEGLKCKNALPKGVEDSSRGVPSVQSHSTFWHRYFYKVREIETENKRLAEIVARASRNDSQDWGWDDDDDDDEDITTNTTTATPKDKELTTTDTNITIDNQPRHEVLHEDTKYVVDQQLYSSEQQNSKPQHSSESRTSSSDKINAKENTVDKNLDSGNQDERETNIDNVRSTSCHNDQEDLQSKVSPVSMETKSEGDSSSRKSDSSDSSSWIRVLDKEGTSSSSSVVVVNENDGKELDSDEQLANDVDVDIDNDDDDDDFDFNEDISNEDVEKLVQSITANELDSGEDDWEDWE